MNPRNYLMPNLFNVVELTVRGVDDKGKKIVIKSKHKVMNGILNVSSSRPFKRTKKGVFKPYDVVFTNISFISSVEK